MRSRAQELGRAAEQTLKLGDLKGLLFGNGQKFLEDLALQLNLKAAAQDFLSAKKSGASLKVTLMQLASTADSWLKRTGYQNTWIYDLGLENALRELGSSKINALLQDRDPTEDSAPRGLC